MTVREVCLVIWDELVGTYMPTFTEKCWKDISTGFEQRTNFSHCIGAVDGKHIRMIKPIGTGSQHYNYKYFFSIVLLTVVDSDYKFIYVDVGSFGKDSDSTIFLNSTLWTLLSNNSLNIPEPSVLPNTNETVPYLFVGDEAFGLSKNVLRPYRGRNYQKKKEYSIIDYHVHGGMSNVLSAYYQTNGGFFIGH